MRPHARPDLPRPPASLILACLAAATLGLPGCKKGPPKSGVALPFSDDFERKELGPNWTVSGGHWELEGGQVVSTGANNAPLFLNVDLPSDVVIEVDVKSETPIVDAKVELMNDGRTHASGYVFILGGWQNQISCIARLDEHGTDRKERRPTGVTGPRAYHWRIEKQGGHLRWFIDGQPYMSFEDAAPLEGPGHNRLSFSNWQNHLRYDNLKVWAFDGAPKVQTSSAAGAAP